MQDKLLYKPVSTLNTLYKFEYEDLESASVKIPAGAKHASLFCAEEKYREIFNKKYSSNIDKVNIATGAITVLYTDTSKEEGYLGEDIEDTYFDILVPDNTSYTFTTKDFYNQEDAYDQENVCKNKALRSHSFNEGIRRRIRSYGALGADFEASTAISTVKEFNIASKKANFHELFHHSEQGLMHLMDQDFWQKDLLKRISSIGDAKYIYGFVLDVFSTRNLCANCNIGLIGLQNSQEAGFLNTLNSKLGKKGFEPRENGLMLSSRVSCNSASKNSDISPMKNAKSEKFVEFNFDEQSHVVMQALGSKLSLPQKVVDCELTIQDYGGAFFTSRTISNKKVDDRIDRYR